MSLLISIVITIVSILIFSMMVCNKFFYVYEHRRFDKEKWLENRDQRYYYIKDLIHNNWLNNLSKLEVIDLLGYEFNDMNSNEWTYYVGRIPGFLRIKKKKLYIYFNKEDEVIDVVDY